MNNPLRSIACLIGQHPRPYNIVKDCVGYVIYCRQCMRLLHMVVRP